jgi:hypothetical protein
VGRQGRPRQKVVANLGRRDVLDSVLPMLNRFLHGEEDLPKLAEPLASAGPVKALDASTWGPMLVARHLFEQLGLWNILDAGRRWPKLLPGEDPDDDWPSRVLALLANRLTRPGSEHALANWLESDYVYDRHGRRYVPCWKQRGRVKVDARQLQSWYRALDHLHCGGCVAGVGNRPAGSRPHPRRNQNRSHSRQPARPPSSAGSQAVGLTPSSPARG